MKTKKLVKLGVTLASVAVLGGANIAFTGSNFASALGTSVVRADDEKPITFPVYYYLNDGTYSGTRVQPDSYYTISEGESITISQPEIPGYTISSDSTTTWPLTYEDVKSYYDAGSYFWIGFNYDLDPNYVDPNTDANSGSDTRGDSSDNSAEDTSGNTTEESSNGSSNASDSSSVADETSNTGESNTGSNASNESNPAGTNSTAGATNSSDESSSSAPNTGTATIGASTKAATLPNTGESNSVLAILFAGLAAVGAFLSFRKREN